MKKIDQKFHHVPRTWIEQLGTKLLVYVKIIAHVNSDHAIASARPTVTTPQPLDSTFEFYLATCDSAATSHYPVFDWQTASLQPYNK